jgi:ABC-type transporter Mla MlaB component
MAKKKLPIDASPSGGALVGGAADAAAPVPTLAGVDRGAATGQAVLPDVALRPDAFLLDANLSIQFVDTTHRQLAAIWNGSEPAVDVSRVMAIDTAGIQLLLALVAEGARLGTALRVDGYSGAISNALGALGMQGMIPMAPPHAGR